MESVALDLPVSQVTLSLAIAGLAGVVKGIVGFAMPMIMISLLGSFLSPDLALAGLMLPTLVTNGMQALRQGPRAAAASLRQFRVFMVAAALMLIVSAQIYAFLPVPALFAAIGLPVVVFCGLQIAGWRASLARQHAPIEAGVGAFAGFIGGLSGVWGPPLVAYLTALNTEKTMQMRTQGAAFGLGTVLLIAAHGPSGVVRPETLAFSALLCIPAVIGMWAGTQVQDRINQQTFRLMTLWILLIAGLNLLRRAWLLA